MASPTAPPRNRANQPGQISTGTAEQQNALYSSAWHQVAPETVNTRNISPHIDLTQLGEQMEKNLENITEGHVAREVTNGEVISRQSLAAVDDLANVMATIAFVPDAPTMHNIRWLKQRSDELASFTDPDRIDVPFASTADRQVVERMKQRIDVMLKKHETERGKDARRRHDIIQTKGGKSAAVWQQLEQLKTGGKNTVFDVNKNEYGGVRAEVDQLLQAIAQGRKPDGDEIRKVVKELQDHRRRLINTLDQSGDKLQREQKAMVMQEEEGQLQQVISALARGYAEEYIQGGGRLRAKLYDDRYRRDETFVENLHTSEDLRDYWFYHILDPILKNTRRETHRDLTSLDVINDLEIFMDVLRDAPNGKALVNHYTMLKNMIYQTHDMDYYAAHPAQDIKEFSQSTAFFTNSYIDFGYQQSMVAMAKRMYEVALMQIREDHGGYIPRRYLEYTEDTHTIELDERVKKMMLDAVRNKQYYDTPRDPVTGLPNRDRWMRVQQGKEILTEQEKLGGKWEPHLHTEDDVYGGKNEFSGEWGRELGDLRIAAAAKMAKGLALVDMRFLEIVARSAGSGSRIPDKAEGKNYSFGGKGLGSVPYEGIVKHLEPIIHYYSRFGIGLRHFRPFFSMLISENPKWNPEQIRNIIKLQMEGNHKKLREDYGSELDTQLLHADNPFSFSGMWGSFTGWRNAMSSEGWDDWERERFSTANKLSFIGDSYVRFADDHGHMHSEEHGSARNANGLASRKVEEYFLFEDNRYTDAHGQTARGLYGQLREKYRNALLRSNVPKLVAIATNPLEFEYQWRTIGLKETDPETGKTYKRQLEIRWEGENKKGGAKSRYEELRSAHKQRELQMKLERAYKARIWAQAAMRNPLAIARELKSGAYDIAGHTRERALRDKIIWELLEIDTSTFHDQREPTLQEFKDTKRITDLESAVASMTQKAVRENKDLIEADFNDIEDPVLRTNAKKYWEKVRGEMLGRDEAGNIRTGAQWYQKLGIQDADPTAPVGSRSHRINWHTIDHDISLHDKWDEDKGIFHHPDPAFQSRLLTGKTIDRDWRYLFSTEDMGWEFLNVTALGERNPVRRAGDLGAHAAFNEGLDKLLGLGGVIGPHLNEEKLHETLLGMWQAMAGDDADVALDSCGRIFYTTMMMYRKADWAWKIPGISQALGLLKEKSVIEMLYGNMHGEALGPNRMLQNIHKAEEAGYVLPSVINPLTGERDSWTEWDAHSMEKRLGGTIPNAVYELATQALMAIIAITIWRAMTAESEDDSASGGGGGGHH